VIPVDDPILRPAVVANEISLSARLAEIRRRLGPYTALQHEPWRMCDAEIARRLLELIEIVAEIARDIEAVRRDRGRL
jgi:hypothetical protein